MKKIFNAWPKDWPKTLNYPDITVYDFLDQTTLRVPNRIALIFRGMEMTYSELKELSERFATALAAMGVKKGDRVAIHLPNCPQFPIAYYGLLRIGAVFTPLSPLLRPVEFQKQLNDSGAETLVSLDLLFPGVKDVIPNTKIKNVITTSMADNISAIKAPFMLFGKIDVPDTIDMAKLLKDTAPNVPKVSIDPKKDIAHIAYTGGTTGVSKGVVLTHHNIVANVMQFGSWLSGAGVKMENGKLELVYPAGVDPKKDRLLCLDNETALVVAPWFHAMGTVGFLNCLVMAGNTMVVLPTFEPKEYVETAVKYKVTGLGGAPQTYVPMMNLPGIESYDLSSVRIAGSGSAPLAGAIMDRLLQAFSGVVLEAYGLSECTMCATSNPPTRSALRYGSVGLPVADTEIKVVDVNTGEELPPDKEGELCIKGPQVMQCYWNKTEETALVLKDGWLHTGDIGKQDKDGYFYITDRLKDMIIYKGYNIYPKELEEILFRHPAVQQCAVVGKPDEAGGEVPVAFVALKPGVKATEQEIMDFINEQIAHYKKVRGVKIVDLIPTSEVGKILKRELKKTLSPA